MVDVVGLEAGRMEIDSGGPSFTGDSLVVAGVASFVKNGNCAGTGGVFRVDRANVLAFINNFIATHP